MPKRANAPTSSSAKRKSSTRKVATEKRNRSGQPCALEDIAVRKALLKGIQIGLTLEQTCAAAGVTYRSYRSWILRGQRAEAANKIKKLSADSPEVLFLQFFQAVKKAEADSEGVLLERIRNASKEPSKWQAAAWMLERRWPEKYGRRDRVAMEHTSPGRNVVAVELSAADELIELIYGAGQEGVVALRERHEELTGATEGDEDDDLDGLDELEGD